MLLLVVLASVYSLPCWCMVKESSETQHIVFNSLITHTTHTMPTRNIPEAPELETPAIRDKMLVPNGVHYRNVHCHSRLSVKYF